MKNKSILLSGGLDSIALTYRFRNSLRLAITIDYGQRSAKSEIAASSSVCKALGIDHEILKVDCSSIGSGEMAEDTTRIDFSPTPEWWPYRNQFLVTIACMKIVRYDIKQLIIGSVKTDARYVDGTYDFYEKLNKAVSMQEGNVRIMTPAIEFDSVELIKWSRVPDSILFWGHSCNISNKPCGKCGGCEKYLQIMESLGYE